MKKHLVLFSTLVLFSLCGCYKPAGDPVTQNFSIDGSYTKLCVENAFDVIVSDSATQITITAGENVMPKIMVEEVDDELTIRLKPWTFDGIGSRMKLILPYSADLSSVSISSATEFHSAYGLKGEKIAVELSGASDFYCDIDADEVDVDISGASNLYGDITAGKADMDLSGRSSIDGNVTITELDLDLDGASGAKLMGQASNLKINLSGASRIIKTIVGNRYGLVCEQCEGEMSGASKAYIHCDGSIRVNLSGASNLCFTGEGNPVDSNTTGGSNINHDVLP